MTDPMARAREMLAAEYEADNAPADFVAELRSGNVNRTGLGIPLRALCKALTREDEVRGERDKFMSLYDAARGDVEQLRHALAEERERAARIAESWCSKVNGWCTPAEATGNAIAAAIRSATPAGGEG